MEKIEWRKDKSYSMKKSPQILEVPKKPFFSIRGIGDPNQEDFKRRVACLYAVSYAIRMSPKKNWLIPDYVYCLSTGRTMGTARKVFA